MLGVKGALKKIGGQRLQKRWVAGRIARANVIDWIDNSNAEEIAPNAIRHRFCEHWILFRRHPIDKRFTPVFIANLTRSPEGHMRRHGFAGFEMLHLATVVV